MDDLTPEQRFAMDDESVWVPRALAQGRPKDAIVEMLVKLDWNRESAIAYVDRHEEELRQYAASPESRRKLLRRFKIATLFGALWTLFSAGVTLSTFIAAAAVGGEFLVMSGAFIFGLALLGYGISGWRRFGGSKPRL